MVSGVGEAGAKAERLGEDEGGGGGVALMVLMIREKEALQWSSSQTFGLATIREKWSTMSPYSSLQQKATRREMRRVMSRQSRWQKMCCRTSSRGRGLGDLPRRELLDRRSETDVLRFAQKPPNSRRNREGRDGRKDSLGKDLMRRDERGMGWVSRGSLKVMRRKVETSSGGSPWSGRTEAATDDSAENKRLLGMALGSTVCYHIGAGKFLVFI